MYQEQLAAYQYISLNLGEGTAEYPETDIRSRYVGGDAHTWLTYCLALQYANIPATERSKFSEHVFTQMKNQLCGAEGEFNYLIRVANFKSDLDYVFTRMQVTSGSTLGDIYNAVKPVVGAEDGSRILYNSGIVIRGILTAGTSTVTNPYLKGTMGAVNGFLSIAQGLSKDQNGQDYTSLDTALSSLETEMNNLWSNLQRGKEKLFGIVMSDWGKLKYVAEKLTTEEQYGGWRYVPVDREDWINQVTNTLEAYYFRSLIPAVWRIDYMLDSTDIPEPKNYAYFERMCGAYGCQCQPYCKEWSDSCADGPCSATAYLQYSHYYGYIWFVLRDGWDMTEACPWVHYDRSHNLRDILFGEGSWAGGQKLYLDRFLFYERWLPSSVYSKALHSNYEVVQYDDCN